jgi:hypothetical protein
MYARLAYLLFKKNKKDPKWKKPRVLLSP